jgi:hypothetical protein
MSADNGIYILKTHTTFKNEGSYWVNTGAQFPVYRVEYIQGIDNLYWCKENDICNLGYYMWAMFKDSPVFESESAAQDYALSLEKKYDYLEYGICSLGDDFYEYKFPTDL